MGEGFGQVEVEGLGQHTELAEFGHGLDAGDDGDGDAGLTGTLDETEVFLVVVEDLGDGIVGTEVLLLAQYLKVELEVGSLLVFLGVGCHTIGEGCAGAFDGGSIDEVALVEAVDLLDEFGGMAVSVLHGLEASLVLGLVTSQHEDVLDAEKLEVEEHVLDVFLGHAAHHHMGHHLDAVALHDGTGHGDGAGTAAHELPEVGAAGLFYVDVLAAVGGDVDVLGLKLFQRVDGAEEGSRACAFEGRQHFEGEGGAVGLIDEFRYCHGV